MLNFIKKLIFWLVVLAAVVMFVLVQIDFYTLDVEHQEKYERTFKGEE